MTHDHIIAIASLGGAWLLGIGVGYVCAKRDWRAEAERCALQWRAAHARLRARVAELEAAGADAGEETTLSGGRTYEDIVRSSQRGSPS